MDDTDKNSPFPIETGADPAEPENIPEPNLVAERLVSLNGLVSLILLLWSAVALMKPAVLRRQIRAFWRRWPWIVGVKPPS